MIEIKSEPGQHIRQAAERLVETVKTQGADAFIVFNDICLPANRFSTVDGLCDEFDRLSEQRRIEYRNSPQGIAMAQRLATEKAELQQRADTLMSYLPNLDFTNVGDLLDWLCEIEEPRDRVGVNVDVTKIKETFIAHGYQENMCCGDEFNENDPDIFAKWIIGQGLGPVPLVRNFTDQWKAKFNK